MDFSSVPFCLCTEGSSILTPFVFIFVLYGSNSGSSLKLVADSEIYLRVHHINV